jgi:hypothetical protein
MKNSATARPNHEDITDVLVQNGLANSLLIAAKTAGRLNRPPTLDDTNIVAEARGDILVLLVGALPNEESTPPAVASSPEPIPFVVDFDGGSLSVAQKGTRQRLHVPINALQNGALQRAYESRKPKSTSIAGKILGPFKKAYRWLKNYDVPSPFGGIEDLQVLQREYSAYIQKHNLHAILAYQQLQALRLFLENKYPRIADDHGLFHYLSLEFGIIPNIG